MILTGRQILSRNIFTPQTVRSVHEPTGMTYGASYASYDIRLKQDVTLISGAFALASSLEHISMPWDTLGFVHDKSTLARQGLHAGQGVLEPGWRGHLTIELAYHGYSVLQLVAGQPIAQIVFHRLDEPLEVVYNGKYQDQINEPVGPKRAVGF